MILIVAKVLYTAPTVYPVKLGDDILQAHLGTNAIFNDIQYRRIEMLIKVATDAAEKYTRRRFITQTWQVYLSAWPSGDSMKLPFGNLQSITHVKYTETDGTVTTWDSGEYNADIKQEPGRVVLEYGYTWPSASLHPQNPIEVQYVCGYGDTDTDVPESIRHAISVYVADLYENRQDINFTNQQMTQLKTFESLLMPRRLWHEF